MWLRCTILSLLVALAACQEQSSNSEIKMKVAHNGPKDHPYQVGYQTFADVLEKETGGKVAVEIFPASQLGKEEDVTTMLKLGVISSTVTSSAALGTVNKEVDVLNFPFIFRDLDHLYKVLDGPTGERLAAALEKDLNSVVLGWWFGGVRNVWNAQNPVTVPEDLNGMKIRVISSPTLIDAFNALGAQATVLPFSELYPAAQLGLVDGGESDAVDILSMNFYQVSKYVSKTQHLYLSVPLMFSKKKFDKLSPELQAAVRKAGKASVAAQRQAMEKDDREFTETLKELGLVYNEVDGAKFREAIQQSQLYELNAERVGGIDKVNEIINQ